MNDQAKEQAQEWRDCPDCTAKIRRDTAPIPAEGKCSGCGLCRRHHSLVTLADHEDRAQETQEEGPRAWVGCLACYNAGRLSGRWVDGVDADGVIPEGHQNICLRCGARQWESDSDCPRSEGEENRGHYRGLVGPDGLPHEELWVMDHEGYGGLLSGECSPMEAARIAEAIGHIDAAGHPIEAVAAYRDHVGAAYFDLDDLSDFEEAYQGEWETEEQFGEQLAEDIGMLSEVSESIAMYFDYEKFTRDLFMGDYFSCEAPGGMVYVFRSL